MPRECRAITACATQYGYSCTPSRGTLENISPALAAPGAIGFADLRETDPDGLGQVPEANIRHMDSATQVIEQVAASTDGAVGFFVQFADPSNASIRPLAERNLRVVPAVSRELLRVGVGDQAVHEVQEFSLSEGGVLGIGGCRKVPWIAW